MTAVQLALATHTDSVLSQAYPFIQQGWPKRDIEGHLEPYLHKKNELTVESDCSLWGARVVIPDKYHKKLLSELHHDHPGIMKMKAVAHSYFWCLVSNESTLTLQGANVLGCRSFKVARSFSDVNHNCDRCVERVVYYLQFA